MSNLQIPTNSNERQGSIIDSFKSFNLDNISHGVRRNLTQVDPRLPKEIRNITLLVKEERNVLTSLQNAASEKKEASVLLQIWGKEMGEDLTDITEKLSDLTAKISDTEQVFTEKYAHYRNLLKEIRTAEESLIPSRERKRKINEEIQKIQKSHPKSPRIPELEADLVHVNKESASIEVEVGNTIRKKLKEALKLLFEATFESSEKIAIISGFGWDIVGQIDETPYKPNQGRPRYSGGEVTQQAIKDCQVALLRWQPTSSSIRPLLPALTNTAPAALAAQKQEYEAKLNQLTVSMNTLKETHDSQINKYNEKLNEQKEAYETRVNEFMTELTSQKGGFEAQLNDLSSALSKEKETAEQKINELNEALTSQKEKYESQLKQYNILMTTNQEYEAALKERDSIISKLQENINSVATEKNKLSNVVKDLEETLKSKATTIDQKEDKVGKLEDEISSIKNQLSELKFSAPINTDQLSDPGRFYMDEAPPAYDGPKKEYPEDKKS
ncbi:11133_t:CDS:2 [Diversispora eburnea]|uniref:11133_t:CDS:1 n=1 Tax=Diversispora eburnea TaxID=1213867 RepID=A0A9N9A080_9GLOM|nr:11133_t:CDS:2 [Diversispora eburnea]